MTTVGDIVEFLKAEDSLQQLAANAIDTPIVRPAHIRAAKLGEISYCSAKAKNFLELLARTQASLVILDRTIADEAVMAESDIQAVILSDNARLDFSRVMTHFFDKERPAGIHPTAVIASSAKLGRDVYIGPLCSIGEKAEIDVETVVHSGVHIYGQVYIGRHVTINSGTVIGKDGWGYERNKQGRLEKIPHFGVVRIGNSVDIGANVSIDRGTLEDTVIADGCKINNATHIGHNVEIGEDTIVLPHVYLGGSSKVGSRCWIGPHTTVRNGIHIGSYVCVGMGSVITKDIPSGVTVMGAPARESEDQKKLMAHWADVISKSNQR